LIRAWRMREGEIGEKNPNPERVGILFNV